MKLDDDAVWIKRKYVIKTFDGLDFIVAIPDSEKNNYNPLKVEILGKRPTKSEEHLSSTPHIALAMIDPENYDDLLGFANSWGLLGLSKTKYGQETFLSEVFTTHLYSYFEPEDLFREKSWGKREPILLMQKAISDYQRIIKSLMKYKNYELPPEFTTKKEKREFVEKIKVEENKNIPNAESDIHKINAIKKEAADSFVIFSEFNLMLKDSSPQMFWDMKGSRVTRGSKFNSLLSAMYLRVMTDIQEGKFFIQCNWHNCRKLFIPNKPNNHFCSERCRNSYNVNNSNKSKLIEKAKLEFPDYTTSELEELVNLLITEGLSGEKKILKEISSRLNSKI